MLDDWKGTYGPVEANVAEFYASLTPDQMIASGLQAQQKEFQKSQAQIQRTMAQRGFGGSSLEAAQLSINEISNAEARATVRAEAHYKTAEMQQGYVNDAQGRRSNIQSGIVSTLGTMGQAAESAASRAATESRWQQSFDASQAQTDRQNTSDDISAGVQLVSTVYDMATGKSGPAATEKQNFMGKGIAVQPKQGSLR